MHAEMDRKTEMILEMVEEDNGDTFGQRAEMFYQKRPELRKLVAEIRSSYHALADKYEHRCDSFSSPPNHDLLLHTSKSNGGGLAQVTPEVLVIDENVEEWEEEGQYWVAYTVEEPTTEPPVNNTTAASNNNVDDSNIYSFIIVDDDGVAYGDPLRGVLIIDSQRVKLWDELRMSVGRLIDDNLSHQAELVHRNDQKREWIRKLGLYVQQLQNENANLKLHVDDHAAANNKKKTIHHRRHPSHMSRLKAFFFGKH